MERYKCRFCFKSFINGRALGGHMRSHMLYLSPKPELYQLTDEEEEQLNQLKSDASSSSDEDEDHRKCSEFDFADDDEVESETESSKINPTRRRSKRTRKLGSFDLDFKKLKSSKPDESVTEPEHQSSVSDTTTEEDLAFCLIMLSKDKWKKTTKQNVEEEEEEDETEHEFEDYRLSKNRSRFKCETCGKVFKSYQALGGHRASHKKNKTLTTMNTKTEYDNGVIMKNKIYECPICFRVFTSGQALGGHKRSHGSNIGGSLSVNQIVRINKEDLSVKQRMIDLNLPAINEDDETSVVFDEL